MSDNRPEHSTEAAVRPKQQWWRVLLISLGAFVVGVGVLMLTRNPNVFPTVIMIGNFMVPVAYVTFFYERRHLSSVKMPATALTFIYGGVLGTLAAALLEPLFIRRLDFQTAFVVGLIEEFVKIWGVLIIARSRRHDAELDGIILGAAAGMGFAAFESSGYAFSAFLRSGGVLSAVVGVTMLRGILSPIGHGTWTALFAAVLFRDSKAHRFRLTLPVLGAYLTAVVLHGLWDGLPGVVAKIARPGIDVLVA
jgi:RsiW-degrading membrane proteinase PrsW (M82 family)